MVISLQMGEANEPDDDRRSSVSSFDQMGRRSSVSSFDQMGRRSSVSSFGQTGRRSMMGAGSSLSSFGGGGAPAAAASTSARSASRRSQQGREYSVQREMGRVAVGYFAHQPSLPDTDPLGDTARSSASLQARSNYTIGSTFDEPAFQEEAEMGFGSEAEKFMEAYPEPPPLYSDHHDDTPVGADYLEEDPFGDDYDDGDGYLDVDETLFRSATIDETYVVCFGCHLCCARAVALQRYWTRPRRCAFSLVRACHRGGSVTEPFLNLLL